MNQNRLKIAEATALPLRAIDGEAPFEGVDFDDLDFTPDKARATVEAWVWLLGADSANAREAARDEVLSDAPLFVALNLPAAEFLVWWRRVEWGHFPRSDTEGEGWAWAVLDRARQRAAALGPMAGQVSMVADAAGQMSRALAVARLRS